MPDFTSIFGNEIKVTARPRKADRQRSRYAGAHGATGMLMGSGGYPIKVTGNLRVTGQASYQAARNAMFTLIESIESIQWYPEQIYTYRNEIYQNVIFLQFDYNLDAMLVYTTAGDGVLPFITHFWSLL